MDWYFVPTTSGIQPAESVANPLANTRFSSAELLCRESLQNSIDETIPGETLKFRIRKHELKGAEKHALLNQFQLAAIRDKALHFVDGEDSRWFRDGYGALDSFDDPQASIPLLEVSDFNANGLTGNWSDGESEADRFYNLVLSEYRTSKAKDGAKLGSWGIGKIVFARASAIRTAIYYSKFRPDASSDHEDTRLMSVAYLPEFKENGTPYAGYSYFGEDSGLEHYPRRPVVGRSADMLVESLGLNLRPQNEYGTSVLIPFCDIDIEEIARAIEKWWWPYLNDQEAGPKLEILIEDQLGQEYVVDHSARKDLRPYVRAYRDLNSGFGDGKTDLSEVKVRVEKKLTPAGKFGAQLVPKREVSDLNNRVALVRNGLVIAYEQFFNQEDPQCAGVFVASKDKSKFFVHAEAEAHDAWNENLDRLELFHGQAGKDFIRLSLNQIESHARTFQIKSKGTIQPKEKESLRFLDKGLGLLLRPSQKGGGDIDKRARVPFIHKSTERINDATGCFDQIDFEVGLKEPDLALEYDLYLAIAPLVDSEQTPGERLPIDIYLDDEKLSLEPGRRGIQVSLESGVSLSGRARAKVSPEWSTAWTIALEPRELI